MDGARAAVSVPAGQEWLVDAHGCDPVRLGSEPLLRDLIARIVRELDLRTAGEPLFRTFPEPGGVTGLLLLMESHLTVHTFPERGFAAFNLYSCREKPEWPWAERLRETLGAERVDVRLLTRGAS
jgi:S-adenosylmethionine decarboxylase